KGPPITEQIHVIKFKKKNPAYFEKDGYLWVETSREFSNFSNFLNQFIKDRIPENFRVINCSGAFNSITSSGKKAINILKNIILPFYI
ncbi:MAG: hypothetical protein ACFFDF_10005, partial [Candidatus Odinarchaeota archaeon]